MYEKSNNAMYNVRMALNIKPLFPLDHPTVTEIVDLIKLEFYLEDKAFDAKKKQNAKNDSYSKYSKKKWKKVSLKRKLNII